MAKVAVPETYDVPVYVTVEAGGKRFRASIRYACYDVEFTRSTLDAVVGAATRHLAEDNRKARAKLEISPDAAKASATV